MRLGGLGRVRWWFVSGQRLALLMCSAAMAMSAAACGGDVDIKLNGSVRYDGYQSGPIALVVAEESSDDCTLFSCSSSTPGKVVKRSELMAPGEFSIKATVEDSDSETAVLLAAYALGGATETWNCEAGAALSLPAESREGITLILEPGICPARE